MDTRLTAARRPRRRLPEETRHILIGVLVMVLASALFAFSSGRGSLALGSYRVVAHFNSVEGVFLDSPVRLSGVQIGRVAELDYDSGSYRAVVSLEIGQGIQLPADSIAIVTSDGMLGDRFIQLVPGGAFEMLADGDEIEFTQDSIMFEELLAKIILTVERQRAEAAGAADGGTQGSGQ